MRFLDLFAGVGGFRRGMEMAGHECVGFCEYDKYATASYTAMHLATDEQLKKLEGMKINQRKKEILKEEYRNGEWFKEDIKDVTGENIPEADCWCFGAPCQDFSVAGRRSGLEGDRSSLVREVFRILGEIKEERRPEWLIYENVKGMLSSNRGFDYLAILLEMDRLGYDVEWNVFNSKDFVPQNRERVYTIGHLRRKGARKIFFKEGTSGEDSFRKINDGVSTPVIKDSTTTTDCCSAKNRSANVNIIGHRDGYRRNLQTFFPDGITEALDTAGGGGRGHHVGIPINVCDSNDYNPQDDSGKSEMVLIGNSNPSGKGMNGNIYSSKGLNPALTTNKGEGNKIAICLGGL